MNGKKRHTAMTRKIMFVGTVFALLAASFSHAATLYFDGTPTTADGASSGGIGTWDLSTANWDSGSAYVNWVNANGDDAVIANGATITIGEPITAGSLTFTSTSVKSYTIAGSEITINNGMYLTRLASLNWTAPIKLGGNQIWTHNQINANSTAKNIRTGGTALNGYTLTWDTTNEKSNNRVTHSDITGTGNIVKEGPGWLGLGGVNTYTGSTTINAGTLEAASGTALGNATNQLTVNTGGNLGINGQTLTIGNLTGTGGSIYLHSSNNRTFTIGSGDKGGGNYQGVIADDDADPLTTATTGVLSLTKIGTGTITLSGANTYSGATTISDGTLVISGTLGGNMTVGAAGSLSPVAGGAGTLTIGGNLDVSAMADDTGKLLFDLANPAASDCIAVTGTLTIGTGTLGLSDFGFTSLGGQPAGVYKLITSSGITGTLNSSDLKGVVPDISKTVTLQITGNDIELVVAASGTVISVR